MIRTNDTGRPLPCKLSEFLQRVMPDNYASEHINKSHHMSKGDPAIQTAKTVMLRVMRLIV